MSGKLTDANDTAAKVFHFHCSRGQNWGKQRKLFFTNVSIIVFNIYAPAKTIWIIKQNTLCT